MTLKEISFLRYDENSQTDSSTSQCPECGGFVTTNAKETLCEDCGLVLREQQIDRGPEWRSFDKEKRRRTGAPLTVSRHDNGFSTKIGYNTDANGNELSEQKRRRLNRMRRHHSRSKFNSKAERNLAHGMTEVRRITGKLGLSNSLRDQACRLFRTAQNEDLLKGRSIESFAAACVYGACRCNGKSRFLSEIVSAAQVGNQRVTNAYNHLNKQLDLPAQPPRPTMFIPRLASRLNCPEEVQHRAQNLARQAEESGITTGVNPAAFAAGCLYQVSQEQGPKLTQVEAAKAADVTANTVRTHRDALVDQVL